jgi:HTH-type transcriptional regulator/antitoxin HipB
MEYRIRTLEQLRPILVGFRKQAGLSQTAVASLLGVSQQSYAKIEANPSATSIERLFKILSLLGADISISDRMPAASEREPADVAREEGTGTAAVAPRKKRAAPPKLTPPSKKPERW